MEKLLDWENSHLYNKLGLKWKLARQRCDSTLMMEYVSNYHDVKVIISSILKYIVHDQNNTQLPSIVFCYRFFLSNSYRSSRFTSRIEYISHCI